MSSINSIGSMGNGMSMMQSMRKPDTAKMAETLFNKLDTAGQGYLEKADFESAFSEISSSSASSTSSTVSVDEMFSKLDTDSDGKVTKDEFSATLNKVAEQLHQQFMDSRMQNAMQGGMGAMGGMPPPPPPPQGDDAGFTQDELSSQLEEIGSTDSTDSARSTLLSSIVENFDAADTNSDGKVSMSEAQAYAADNGLNGPADKSASSTGTEASASSESKLMQQIMRLVQAYNLGEENTTSISTTA